MEIKKMDNYRITNDFDEVFYVDNIYGFKNGLSVVKKNEKYGFINEKGNLICDIKYENVHNFINGMAEVKENGKWGFINKEGEPICEIKYDLIYSFKAEGFAYVYLDGKKYLMNKKGETLLIV